MGKMLNLLVLMMALLATACGSQPAEQPNTVFAVRAIDQAQFSSVTLDEALQVAVLTGDIDTEAKLQQAAVEATWIPIDRFSDSDNFITFKEVTSSGAVTASGCGQHCGGNNWRPYQPQWHHGRRPGVGSKYYYGYSYCGHFIYWGGTCILPHTPIYNYTWTPKTTFRVQQPRVQQAQVYKAVPAQVYLLQPQQKANPQHLQYQVVTFM